MENLIWKNKNFEIRKLGNKFTLFSSGQFRRFINYDAETDNDKAVKELIDDEKKMMESITYENELA